MKGFAGWMDWWSIKISGQSVARVSRDIEGREDILATRIFRRTKTFVSNKLWPILDPIVKHYQDPAVRRQILSDIELKILETIGTEGSIRTDRLRKKLKLEAKLTTTRQEREHLQALMELAEAKSATNKTIRSLNDLAGVGDEDVRKLGESIRAR